MIDTKKIYTSIKHEQLAMEERNSTQNTLEDDLFISMSKKIILNNRLLISIRIIQLMSVIPRKTLVITALDQLGLSNKVNIEDYLVLVEIFG